MKITLTENRKYCLTLLFWWTAVLYALFCILHPFLSGCGCGDIGPEHTCGIVQYIASIGSVGWMLLLPLGMYLFRRRENMLIFLEILAFVPLTCALFWMLASSAGWFSGDLLTTGMAEIVIMLLLSIPILPYIGILPLMGAVTNTDALVWLVFVYTLAAAGYGIYRYRHRAD